MRTGPNVRQIIAKPKSSQVHFDTLPDGKAERRRNLGRFSKAESLRELRQG
jgi:hypothetical protein